MAPLSQLGRSFSQERKRGVGVGEGEREREFIRGCKGSEPGRWWAVGGGRCWLLIPQKRTLACMPGPGVQGVTEGLKAGGTDFHFTIAPDVLYKYRSQ